MFNPKFFSYFPPLSAAVPQSIHSQKPDQSRTSGSCRCRHSCPDCRPATEKRICNCKKKGCPSCNCKRHYSQPYYEYCKQENITPFIGLNPRHTGHFTYKDDFTIDDYGVPVCKLGLRMHKDGYEAVKHRAKYRCPKSNRKRGCFCEHPCSPAKYGRTVHIFMDDNPRLFSIPPRDSKAWEKEYDRRTSVERSNKRDKEDYKLEDGRRRSTKMWYCRLYGNMMLQHLDAWEMPPTKAFQKSLLGIVA